MRRVSVTPFLFGCVYPYARLIFFFLFLMQSYIKTVGLSVAFGVLLGVSVVLLSEQYAKPDKNDFIAEYYRVENAVHVSPHGLRKLMDKGDQSFILVDLRSAEEYEKAHIVGAVNIPAYSDPDTSAYDEKERIVNQFRALPKGKDIIVYCYSTPCMTGRKVGLMLVDQGIYVKHLGIGWNEWRYHWNLWNHEHEWDKTKAEDYIVSGKEPGVPKSSELPAPCGVGEFGC